MTSSSSTPSASGGTRMPLTERKRLKDTYRETLRGRRKELFYKEHLARGRRMRCGGVPLEAMSRKDLLALLSYTSSRVPRSGGKR